MGNVNLTNTVNTLSIPHLKHDKIGEIDRDKINNYVIYAFNNCLDNNTDDGIPCLIILPSHGLTSKELAIAEGIILANGINYWETGEEIDYHLIDEDISNQ